MKKILFLIFAVLRVWTTGAGAETGTGDPAKGKAIFDSKCAGCHGKDGRSDTATVKNLKPKPVDLSNAKAISHMSEAEIVKIVSEGGKSAGHSPLMPAWGKQLGEDGVLNVVAHLKALCKCGFRQGDAHGGHHHEGEKDKAGKTEEKGKGQDKDSHEHSGHEDSEHHGRTH